VIFGDFGLNTYFKNELRRNR